VTRLDWRTPFRFRAVSWEPQNQRATTYSCWEPWMTQARKDQVATGTLPGELSAFDG